MLLAYIRRRWGAYRNMKRAQRFDAGMRHAMKVIADGGSISDLEARVDGSRIFGDYDEFDQGIEAAIREHDRRIRDDDQRQVA